MSRHLSACLWLLVVTVFVCCVLYPLILWGYGQLFFSNQANGSLIDAQGNPVTDPAAARGSRLIGQNFKGAEYFQPRPSATSDKPYNAMASGASNWGASNPLLRDRVARQLGPIVREDRPGNEVGPKVGPRIEEWFAQQGPDYAARWAKDHPSLAEQWVKDNAEGVAGWLKKDPKELKGKEGEYALPFFESFVKAHPGTWPTVEDKKEGEKTIKVIKAVKKGNDVQAYMFDPWLQSPGPKPKLKKVPADMVMASGSGLDPHITLDSANYQLPDVVDAWAEKLKMPAGKAKIKAEIEALLKEKAEAPLGGLVGVPLVNVLEVNLALRERMQRLAGGGK
jgi:K+-transporting ATPase ATPase C chain